MAKGAGKLRRTQGRGAYFVNDAEVATANVEGDAPYG